MTDGRGRTGTSDLFVVSAGPPVALVFVATPGAAAGACAGPYEVEARDGLGHPASAPGPVALALDGAPAGVVAFFPDAACATPASSVSLAGGATRAAFYLRAASAGVAAVRVTPATLPSVTVEVGVTP